MTNNLMKAAHTTDTSGMCGWQRKAVPQQSSSSHITIEIKHFFCYILQINVVDQWFSSKILKWANKFSYINEWCFSWTGQKCLSKARHKVLSFYSSSFIHFQISALNAPNWKWDIKKSSVQQRLSHFLNAFLSNSNLGLLLLRQTR